MSTSTRPTSVMLLLFTIICCESVRSQTTYDMALGYRRPLNSDWIGINGANTIRDSLGWPNPYLLAKLPGLNSKNLRYPGGGIANWWNWKTGWFVNRPDLPVAWKDLPPVPNNLESFKQAYDTTGANAILVVNMLTSTLSDQIAMLKHADSIGIAVRFVELGNEFYLDGGDDSIAVVTMFPTAESYADSASRWADTIHHYFPNAKVAAQGAFNRNNLVRRVTWDEGMFPTLHGEDAIAYHSYMSADSYDEDSYISTTFSSTDVPVMLGRPFKMWNILYTEDFPLIPAGKEIWITEYNLRDHSKPVHCCWGHALFLATQTMQFLNEQRITRLTTYALCGTAVGGAFFNTIHGYDFGKAGNFYPPPNPPASTQYWGLTSAGIALQQLGLVLKDANYASPIEFKHIPNISAFDGLDTLTYPSVYGWAFIGSNSVQALVVNLSGTDKKVNTEDMFPGGGTYTRYSADPMLFEAYESDISSKTATLPSALVLKAYSLTRITGSLIPAAPPVVNMVLANGVASFCPGDSAQLDAGPNYVEYRWSTGDSTRKIWVKEDGDYWVHVRSIPNGYYAGDTMHITVNPVPAIPKMNGFPKHFICTGDSISASVKYPDASLIYSWSNGTTGTFTEIKTGGPFTLYATNSFGCSSASAPVMFTEYPLPHPTITALGPTSFCYNQSVVLSVPAGYESYHWSNDLYGQTKEISETGTYYVTVKDSNTCVGQSANSISVTVWKPADPTITVTGPTIFCNDGSTPCTIKTISGYAYQWKKNGNNISGATKKSYKPAEGATYKVLITDVHGCTKMSGTTTITLMKLPSTAITVTGGKKYCPGKIITLSAKVSAGYTYQWKLNGVNISGATLSTYLVASAGDYNYNATDLSGCSKLSAAVIITDDCKTEISESSDGIPASELYLYPNPALNSIHINAAFASENDGAAVLEIKNVLGETVYRSGEIIVSGTCNTSVTFDQRFAQGVYYMHLQSDMEILTQQFLIAGSLK